MNIAFCPYMDGKCGEHSQCVKCTPAKRWIYYLKSKIETGYFRFPADEAFRKNSSYIEMWYNDGLITDADRTELRQHNGELWWKYV